MNKDKPKKDKKKIDAKRPNETMKEFLLRIRQETRKTLVANAKKSSSSTFVSRLY